MAMYPVKSYRIRSFEKGLMFRDGEFQGLLGQGRHRFVDFLNKVRVDIVSQRDGGFKSDELDVIVKSGVLEGEAVVIDLAQNERAVVWIDDRFGAI